MINLENFVQKLRNNEQNNIILLNISNEILNNIVLGKIISWTIIIP